MDLYPPGSISVLVASLYHFKVIFTLVALTPAGILLDPVATSSILSSVLTYQKPVRTFLQISVLLQGIHEINS